MLPNRTIFRSRWKALIWSAIVCVVALQVSSRPGGGDNEIDTGAALAEAAKAMDVQ